MKTAIMSLMIWSWLKNNCSNLLELSQWTVKQICQECGPTVKFPYFLMPQSTLTSKIIYGKLQPNSILKWMDAYGWRKFYCLISFHICKDALQWKLSFYISWPLWNFNSRTFSWNSKTFPNDYSWKI